MAPAKRLSEASFLGKMRTAGYHRNNVFYRFHEGQSSGLTLWDVEEMLRDEQVAIGRYTLSAPVYTAKWTVQGDKPVAGFVDRMLKKFWQQDIDKALEMLMWGSAGGEVSYKTNVLNGQMEYNGLRDIHLQDLRVLVDKEDPGQMVGLRVPTLANGNGDLYHPKCFWIANEAKHGSHYGRSRLVAAKDPWLEKRGKNGAVANRRLWAIKNSFGGGTIRYPNIDVEVSPGVYKSGYEIGREMLENMEAGAVVALPNTRDDKGNYEWVYEPPQIHGDAHQLLDYPDKLDIAILKGMGILPEVVQASQVGSGWSGRSVPMIIFLASCDKIVDALVRAWRRCIGDPLVRYNYGSEQYEIEPQPLAGKGGEDAQGGGGGMPGPQQIQPPDGDSGQDGQQDGPQGGGDTLGDVMADSGGNPQAMMGGDDQRPSPLSMGPHSYSSTQLNLPQEISSLILDMAGNVDPRDLAGNGFEKEIHVTALYGLHDDDPAEVRRVVEGFGPVRIRLGEISVFPANESDVKRGGDCYDVVKIDVDSPDLHRLHQQLAKLPHTDTYPEYCPHVTLFYAKPGKGQEYAGEHPLMGQEILFNRLVFSASTGERTEIFLTKRKPRGN